MARYMERAENTARLLDVNYQTALLPQSPQAALQGWTNLLSICELSEAYQARHGEVHASDVVAFMVSDPTNPSSIVSCLRATRENARAVRGVLTTEVWETTNHTWLEFNALLKGGAWLEDPVALFEWVKYRSHLSRGVTVGTMLQDESLHFQRIGTFLERADNTARLLDVKFHGVGGASASLAIEGEAQAVDFYHWAAVLRSVSAFEVYRQVYRDVIRPEKVAELLMLRPDMPRSLLACMSEVVSNLKTVANVRSAATVRRAGRLCADLQYADINEVVTSGLHAYLEQFLDRVNELGLGISRDFLVPAERA